MIQLSYSTFIEAANVIGDLFDTVLHCEVALIEAMHLSIW